MNLYDIFAKVGGLFRWWVVVAPWEQAVRVRLGKRATLLHPGLHLRIPGLDRVYRESVRLRTVDLGLQTISTTDGKTVTLSGFIRYKVVDLLEVMNALHHPEDTLADEAMGAIAKCVQTSMAASVTPSAVEEAATLAVQDIGYGLGCMSVGITDFAFVRTYRIIQEARRWNKGEQYDHGLGDAS